MSMITRGDRGHLPPLEPGEARVLARLLLGLPGDPSDGRHRAGLRTKGYLEPEATPAKPSRPMQALADALKSALRGDG